MWIWEIIAYELKIEFILYGKTQENNQNSREKLETQGKISNFRHVGHEEKMAKI